MTRETRSTSISILADTRRSVAVALAALALLGAVAAAGTATGREGTNVVPEDAGGQVRVLDAGSAVRTVEDLARTALAEYLPEGGGIATRNGE